MTHNSHENRASWTISFAFWLALLVSACMYAFVALSPKLLTYLQLRNEHHSAKVQLVRKEHDVDDLKQVIDALQSDPDFVHKLARVDFGARGIREERIPVTEALELNLRDNDPTFDQANDTWPTIEMALQPFARSSRVRSATLLTAAAVLVFAFMFLHESDNRTGTSQTQFA